MAAHSPLFNDLASTRKILLQVSTESAPPNTLRIPAGDGTEVVATLLAAAPRVDPRIQGRSFFYAAPGAKLSAGMNVSAHFAGAHRGPGVVVPRDAIILWQGKSWLYIRRSPTKFARREITAEVPAPGDEVVTTGAQQLLSEEMRSQLHEE
jgi:hypothetical protein